MEKKFGIRVISDGCGILPHTLRIWEQRYQVFRPERGGNGQRLYTEVDLRKAKLLAKLIEHGHTISSLAVYSVDELQSMVDIFVDFEHSKNHDLSVDGKKLLSHLGGYQIDKFADEIQHVRLSVGAKEFIFDFVLPVIRELGILVAKGDYSVTQEHIASTIIRDQLAQIYLPSLGNRDHEMALATPEGNLHELPILIADILCRANRIPTRYLGAAHPAECLGTAINALKSPYLVLGVISTDRWNYEEGIVDYLRKVDSFLERDVKVILGGGRMMALPHYKHITEVIFMNSLEEYEDYMRGLNA